MSALIPLNGEAIWRSRPVRYFKGDWEAVLTVLPEFELQDFAAREGEQANPYLRTVMRKPPTDAEGRIPVGVVSQTYVLVQHRDVADLCLKGLIKAGFDREQLSYEIGVTSLREWMHLSIFLPTAYSFTDAHGQALRLRLECFNSVEGSSRLVILFGWFRFVCGNGLVIGETKIEIKERHGQGLDLKPIPERIRQAIEAVDADRARMAGWQATKIGIEKVTAWADGTLTGEWGKTAAARTFHICKSGRDVEFANGWAPGTATTKPIRYLAAVPGAPEHASTLYDVVQALSFVATHRNNAEERASQQADIPRLLRSLA